MGSERGSQPHRSGNQSPAGRCGTNLSSQTSSASEALVDWLTTKVRLLSLEQVTEHLFQHAKEPRVIARKHLRRMEKQGLVRVTPVMTLKTICVEGPLVDWQPGDGLLDFGHISWLAEKRLAAPLASTLVVQATQLAQARTLGPIGRRPPRSQEITHDLLVASVFTKLLRDSPELAATWKPEDALLQELVAERGDFTAATIPDAVVSRGGGEIAIEVVGRYSPQKLNSIHEALCHERYQLW